MTSSLTAFNLGRIHRGVPTGLILMTSTALWVVAFVLIGLSPILLFLLVGILLYGLGEGVVIPSLQTVAPGAPEEHRGAVMATWTASARLGQTLGPHRGRDPGDRGQRMGAAGRRRGCRADVRHDVRASPIAKAPSAADRHSALSAADRHSAVTSPPSGSGSPSLAR